MIHHETVSAETASEGGGSGHFDIIETDGEIQVFDGHMGMYLPGSFGSVEEAVKAALREAERYDASRKDADEGEQTPAEKAMEALEHCENGHLVRAVAVALTDDPQNPDTARRSIDELVGWLQAARAAI